MTDINKQYMWEFVRGNLSVAQFEKWVYEHNTLEELLGKEFYLELISTNFQLPNDLYEIKQKLEGYLRESYELSCECITLSDLAVTCIGSDLDIQILKSIKQVKLFGELCWWLSLDICQNCHQYWLIAQESKQNDVNLFRRLTKSESDNIIEYNKWPKYFRRFEELLILGKESGASVIFIDPMNSFLSTSIVDLVKDRPDISVSEIALLLNLRLNLAIDLCKKNHKRRRF